MTATSPHVADGVDASTVTVVLKDASGNAVTGLTNADFSIDLNGSSGVAGTVTETGTPGTYTFTVTDTVAETVTVTVTAKGVTLTDEPDIVFTPGDIDVSSSVTATTPHVANGVDASTVTVVLQDANGNALTGLTNGDFSINLNGSSGVAGTVTETGTPGTYTFTVTNTVAETVTVTVTADGVTLSNEPDIVFTPGDVDPSSSVTATTPHIANGVDASTVTVVLRDANGNAVTGLTNGDFSINLNGSSGVAGTVTETGTPGTYTFTVTNTVAETVTVTVTADGVTLSNEPDIVFTPGDIDPSSSVTATTPHVANGVDASTVTVVLKDANGNAVTGLTNGDFSINLNGSSGVAGTVTETATPGTYTFTVTNTAAETVTVTVTAKGVTLTDEPDVVFTPGDVDPSSSVTATTPHIANGVDASTVTVVLKDANGNPLTGLTNGDFSINLNGSSGVAGTVTETGTPGTYTFTVTSTVAETVTVTVTADGVTLTDEPDIVFTPGDVDSGSSVTATSPHVADGVDASTVTVVLKDANGNPLTGLTSADFSINLNGSSGVAGTVTETSTPGTYTFTVTNTVAETVTVTVTVNGVPLTDEPDIVFTPVDTCPPQALTQNSTQGTAGGSRATSVANPGSGNFAGPELTPQANDPNVPCDVDDEIVRKDMKSLSHNFMAQRMNLIAANGPRLAWRNNRIGGFGDDSNGFNVSGESGNITGDFAFSSGKLRKALSGEKVMPTADAPEEDGGRVNAWMEGNFAFYGDEREDEDAKGDFFVGYAGVDLAVFEWINVGIMGEIDWMKEDGDNDGRVSGTGWMVGPYVSARLAEGLFLDARAMRGWSSNSIRQISTQVKGDEVLSAEHEGDFDTDRWLAEATLSGNYDFSTVTLTPDIRFLYMREDQQDYQVECVCKVTDVDGQTVELAQLSGGLRLSRLIEVNDTLFRPYAAGRLFWNIDNPGELTVDGEYVSTDDVRGAVTIGFDANSEHLQFGAEATYDGLFTDGDYAIGGKLSLGYKF